MNTLPKGFDHDLLGMEFYLFRARFFNEGNSGKKVFLNIEGGSLIQLGGVGGREDFIAAVRSGPEQLIGTNFSMCTRAVRVWKEWRDNGCSGLPPFLAHLAFFVFAASEEGQHELQGYYKNLHLLLGEEPTNQYPPGFSKMGLLWEELENWANELNNGSLGIVCCDFAGALPHVGRPRAQIVLTERERSNLHDLFVESELDPSAPPAAEEVAQICRKFGSGRLEARTLRRLAREGVVNEEMRMLTLEAILDELRSWDGVFTTTQGGVQEYHSLRLNLRIRNQLAGVMESYLVVKDCESFLDETISLRDSSNQISFSAREGTGGWLLLHNKEGAPLDGSTIHWGGGFRLTADGLVFRFPSRNVRVFRKGQFDHIEGLIEVNRLDPFREFFVAASQNCADEIDEWGKQAGKHWRRLQFRSGLPSGWILFRADSADSTIPAPVEFSVLKTDSLVRILLQGGIKIEPMGRRYFDFAPPTIRIEGLVPGAVISFNNSLHTAESGDIMLESSLSEIASSNQIKVLLPNKEERSASFQAVSAQSLDWRQKGEWASTSNGSALPVSEAMPRAFGPAIFSFEVPPIPMVPERVADLIGSRPGQLVTLPGDELPSSWVPVWLIEHGRSNRRVIFCGTNIEHCAPSSECTDDRKKVKEWKQLLWNDRKRLSGPTRGPLVSLWRQYKETAENV